LSRERARSFKKGATATSAQTFTFFQALDPFLRPERPRSSKQGATATSAQTFAFFQALDPFLSRERQRSSKKGATATSAPIFTIFQALDPFLSRERPRSSKKGDTATSAQIFNIFQALVLLRRESALLLCKRIPLQTVYAWATSVALLQCKGLNLTSASEIGNWTVSFADWLLLIYRWTWIEP